jgi:hypothetical protein
MANTVIERAFSRYGVFVPGRNIPWFTEGFDTADLQAARTLLDELTEPAIAAEG